MRKRVIYTLLAISLFAMLGTGCSKKAEQKSETTKSAAQTETVGESIGDQTADTIVVQLSRQKFKLFIMN